MECYQIFNVLRVLSLGILVKVGCFLLVLLVSEGLLLNVETLIDASLAVGILLNGPRNQHIVDARAIA